MEGLAIFINNIVNDDQEVEQLTIETFARLAAGGRKFARKSSLKTYLYTIGKNLAVQHVKKRKKDQHLSYAFIVKGEDAERLKEIKPITKEQHDAMIANVAKYRVEKEPNETTLAAMEEVQEMKKKSNKMFSSIEALLRI